MWELPFSLFLSIVVAGKIIFLFLGWLVWRSYRRGFGTGQARMIGLPGKAVNDIAREGRVMVQGEYWWARTHTPIAAGENVRVTGIDGMWLEVEPCPDKTLVPRPVSAVHTADAENQPS
jgi:membrane-bound serine protease (ClpP class)